MTQAYNLSQFANYLNSSGQVSQSGLQAGVTLASGTVSLYYQASAPTGWTQVTTLNDYAMRIVSSSGGSTGGTTAFSSVFTNQTPTISDTFAVSAVTVGSTTLSTTQIPSHSHAPNGYTYFMNANSGSVGSSFLQCGTYTGPFFTTTTGSTGGGGSHTHSVSGGVLSGSASSSTITLNVRYANMILCSKN